MRDEIETMFDRILIEACTPDRVRRIEAGDDSRDMWETLEASGFLGALVPESAGGAGLALQDAAPIAELAGRHALPLPLAETMMLRGLAARMGVVAPEDMLDFGGDALVEGEYLRCGPVSGGGLASHVAVARDGEARLLPAGQVEAVAVPYAMECAMRWPRSAWESGFPLGKAEDLTALQALTHGLQAVGALQAVFDRTLAYANERVQFGRPIGKFQAIQHQLSVMAEHLFAARMAVTLAAHGAVPDRLRVAAAKSRVGRAIVEVTALAHSIHGAIGFTAEYDLQLYTRRLHFWRQAGGNEQYWEDVLGKALVAAPQLSALDLVRSTSAWPLETQ